MTTSDEHGNWVDDQHRTYGRREYHGNQSQFGSGSQRGGHRERCVGCAPGKVGASQDGRAASSSSLSSMSRTGNMEMYRSYSTSGVCLPTVLDGSEEEQLWTGTRSERLRVQMQYWCGQGAAGADETNVSNKYLPVRIGVGRKCESENG